MKQVMSKSGIKFIDLEYIKNCFLNKVEIIFKFEEKINRKHGDLFKFRDWKYDRIEQR